MTTRVRSDPVQLLCLARVGEGEALGRLLELYRGYLTMLARLGLTRRLQGKVEPADLVQDTFLEAHRHFAGFQGTTEAELVGWLRQILAARLANTVRHFLGTRRTWPTTCGGPWRTGPFWPGGPRFGSGRRSGFGAGPWPSRKSWPPTSPTSPRTG